MSDSLVIRPAKRSEADRLTRIAYDAKSIWEYPESQMAAWSSRLTITPQQIENYFVNCAVVDGEVAGFYAMEETSRQYEFEHLWVDPAHRGLGVGKQLFEHAVEFIRDRGTVHIMTILSEPGAEGFYQKMGAQTLTILPTKVPGRNLPFMRKIID